MANAGLYIDKWIGYNPTANLDDDTSQHYKLGRVAMSTYLTKAAILVHVYMCAYKKAQADNAYSADLQIPLNP